MAAWGTRGLGELSSARLLCVASFSGHRYARVAIVMPAMPRHSNTLANLSYACRACRYETHHVWLRRDVCVKGVVVGHTRCAARRMLRRTALRYGGCKTKWDTYKTKSVQSNRVIAWPQCSLDTVLPIHWSMVARCTDLGACVVIAPRWTRPNTGVVGHRVLLQRSWPLAKRHSGGRMGALSVPIHTQACSSPL